MNFGKIEKLKIAAITDHGAYLINNKKEKILLPKKQIPKGSSINDDIEVFLYKDSKDRPIATTRKPFLTVGEIANLTVVNVTDIGAFLNIGLERDLFLPHSEMIKKVKANDKVKVIMYVDKSERLCASMYTNKFDDGLEIDKDLIKSKEYELNADKVYKLIKEKYKGHLVYNDKNVTSDRIKSDFNISKSKFKDAIGKLLKEEKIKITDKGIYTY